jgi:alpha-N-arabinofuranosidase
MLGLMCFISLSYGQKYCNPVISGFYPDPSVCRVGNDYYLVNSSFHYWPGVPVFHSKDLVNWKQIGHAIHRKDQLSYNGYKPSKGIYAPTIRFSKGLFYVITTMVGDKPYDGPNFIVTASDPAGPWSDPIIIKGAPGIDPSLFFDEDGKVYYVGKRYATNDNCLRLDREIWLQELDPKTFQLVGQSKVLWSGTGGAHPEGPHIYKIGKYYYLMLAEGGTGYYHAETIACSESIWGPYHANPSNPLITSRHLGKGYGLNNVGHADLVETQNGQWYAVLLASSQVGEGYHHNRGRETCLVPVVWENEWPIFSPGSGKLEYSYPFPDLPIDDKFKFVVKDEFDEPDLPLHWNHILIPDENQVSLTYKKGHLSLRTDADTLGSYNFAPSFAGRRQQHNCFTVTTKMEFSPKSNFEEAGLVATHNENCNYRFVVTRKDGCNVLTLIQRINMNGKKILKEVKINDNQIFLRMIFNNQCIDFLYSKNGKKWNCFYLNADNKILTPLVARGFVGTYVGMYASGNGSDRDNYALFDWFKYEPKNIKR